MRDQDQILDILIGCGKMHRESQKVLYQEFYAYGMSICLRYSESRDEASEVLNDGFMKVFQSIKKFDLTRPFKPWFRKIIVNTCINRYHQRQRELHAEDIENARQHADTESILAGIAYEDILGMLKKLPPAYRTVFNLYVIEGFKHEEVAHLLSISVGTSKSNLFKARESLRKILNHFFETENVGRG